MNTKTIAKRLMTGSALRVLLIGCNIIVSFFMMPFVIHCLGDRLYGFWVLVGTFMGYYGFLDLGLSSAVSRYVSRAYGQKDYNEMNIVINTSLVLLCFVGLFVMILTVAVALMSSCFVHNEQDIYIFRIIILILGADMAMSFPMRTFEGILTSTLRFDLSTYILLSKLVIRTFLIVYFIKSGHGLIVLAVITLCVNLFSYGANFIMAKREFPELRFGVSYVMREKIKSLFTYSKYAVLAQIADILRFKIDSFVIVYFIGIKMVTAYFIAAKLIEYFVQLISSLFGVLSPVFSQYEGRGDFALIRRTFLTATNLCSTFTFFVGGCIIFYSKYFINVWMGPTYNNVYPILVILCTSIILALMQNPSVGMLFGTSKHKYFAISNLCEGVLNALSSILLVQYFGILGVAMGTLIGMVIIKIFVQPIYVTKLMEISIIEYFKTLLMPFVKLIFPMLVYFYFAKKYIQYSYLSIFSLLAIQMLLFLPIIYYFVIGERERNILLIALGRRVITHEE